MDLKYAGVHYCTIVVSLIERCLVSAKIILTSYFDLEILSYDVFAGHFLDTRLITDVHNTVLYIA